MTREEAHKLIDQLYDSYTPGTGVLASQEHNGAPVVGFVPQDAVEEPKKLPEGKRAVRTKTSGDKVYLLDEVKKTRQWVTTGEVLTGLGFDQADVTEVDDTELYKYTMDSPIYKVE